MNFTYDDHVQFCRLALTLFELEKTDAEGLQKILDFGELINKHSGENNGLIYDVIEYVYEQQRLLNGEDGAYDDPELLKRLREIADS